MNANIHQRAQGKVLDVAIIGAGFGGLGLAIQLQKQGITNFQLFEQAKDVGGVWRDNLYPGAACDVPSHLYSFSFEPNPQWGRLFSPQQEIYRYLRHCADKYQLRPKIRFSTRVTAADYCESTAQWRLELAEGHPVFARAVVVAIGALNIPQYPNIQGIERFKGVVMHTAQWQRDANLRGKRVAVVGTGASAIQVIPAIQPEVGSLTVFQRTPPWVLPKHDRRLTVDEHARFRRWPLLQRIVRRLQYVKMESVLPAFIWDSLFTRLGEWAGRKYLRSVVKDETLRNALTPQYSMGCKRVLLSDDYYPALCQDNVNVVADGVARMDESAIYSSSGERHEVDAVILATGFKVPSAGAPMPVRGLGGRSLEEDWAEGAEAYKGITVSGYPNLLYLMGPNTGPGNTSVIFYIESQIRYVLQYLQTLRERPDCGLDIKADVQDQYNKRIQNMFRGTTWMSGCNSWYLTQDGRNTTLWPGFSWRYRLMTRRFALSDYRVVAADSAKPALSAHEPVALDCAELP
ncbi:flavin-containing monooxygenase [Spongiibacter marinus]|uniref:flavin-containing monooxygenase n=1 Tax=Spongiibacter marinus TaxID=354246 RepID=UPI0003F621D3|nr:NAD(P)/FAD-dependent oxidoreductase [Spongiibacter marinus]